MTFGLLVVTLPYSYSRNDAIYYQRAIPADLQARYGAKLVKVKLGTVNIRAAARQIALINQQVEAEWKLLRADGESTPKSIREQAVGLLEQWDLKPGAAVRSQGDELPFHDYLDTKRARHARGNEGIYADADPDDYLTPTEVEAAILLAGKHTPRLSDALAVYLSVHPKSARERFAADTARAFGKLIEVVGDKPIAKVERDDGHAFVKKRLAAGAASNSIRRELNVIRAVVGTYLLERKVNKTNPFAKIPIPEEGRDAKESKPYSASELAALAEQCRAKDDDVRWLIGMVADTGARLAEVAGLTLDDIALDAEVPHVVIADQPWRTLKNPASARRVPLVGQALWAAQRVKESAADGQRFAFPRYTTAKVTKANGASAALNKYIKEGAKLDHTVHELRHTMADRLREVECPADVRLAIGGWAREGEGEGYGRGYPLHVLARWLNKVIPASRPSNTRLATSPLPGPR